LQAVAENEAVGPIHLVAIELHRLVVVELWVGEKVARHVLSRRDFEDGLRADPF